MSAIRLVTVGHGTRDAHAFGDLLEHAGIAGLVDVRRFPGSRRHPHFRREAMPDWLSQRGVAYEWEEQLGGRRHGASDSPNVGLRNRSFRAYADYMASGDFDAALARLLVNAREQSTAIMCAESLWWNCHRRLIADAAVLLKDVEVVHLMHDGKQNPHVVTDHAVVRDGVVVYPGDAPTLL